MSWHTRKQVLDVWIKVVALLLWARNFRKNYLFSSSNISPSIVVVPCAFFREARLLSHHLLPPLECPKYISRQHMVVVGSDAKKNAQILEHFFTFFSLLFWHFTRMFIDSCNIAVATKSLLCSNVVMLDSYRLSTRMFILQNNHYFAWFQAIMHNNYINVHRWRLEFLQIPTRHSL